MKELPTVEEAFPQERAQLPTEQEAFPDSLYSSSSLAANAASSIIVGNGIANPAVDQFMQYTPAGRIMGAFGHGFAAGGEGGSLGIEPGGEIEKSLTKLGIFNDYANGEREFGKAINETFIRPAAVAIDTEWRGINALLGSFAGTALQTSHELGVAIEGKNTTPMLEQWTEFLLQHRAEMPHIPTEIPRARSVGVIGESEKTYFGLEEPTPAQAAARQEASSIVENLPENRKTEIVQPDVPDIHTIARNIDPGTFNEYDALQTRRNNLGNWMRDFAEQRRQSAESSAPHAEEIAQLQVKLESANARKTKIYQAKIDELTAKNEEYIAQEIGKDTPELSKVRADMQKIDYRMRDLAPEVSKIYREAETQIPKETIPEVETIEQLPQEPTLLGTKLVEQQLQTIQKDVSDKLVKAGRPLEEAQASSQLIADHYKAISEQGWTKGTPEEIYVRDSANIKQGKQTSKTQGKLHIPFEQGMKNTITLFGKADASTFVHETGHHWLEEMSRYAKADDAPAGLLKNMETVNKWLGVEEGKSFTRKQHEKFARGFERYLMEGTAPSQALANVFDKFKQWLTSIYQTVQKLKSPITDEIRDVFDRLLSSEPNRTIVAAEREAPPEGTNIAETISHEKMQPQISGETPIPKVVDFPNEVKSNKITPEEKANLTTNSNAILPSAESKFVNKAGNIRLDNLNTTEDISRIISDIAEDNQGFIGARRGVISDGQILDLADALGMSPESLNTRKLGEAFNAEQVVAARKLLIHSATELRDLGKIASEGAETDLISYAQARDRHRMIQEHVSGITAEAGRALRAFSKLEGAGETRAIGEILKESTGMDLFQLQREAKLISELDSPAKVSQLLQDSRKATYPERLLEYWINALLSNPVTHAKNLVGNSLVAVNSVIETVLTSQIGKILKSEDRIQMNEAKARFYGITQGATDGLVAAGKIIKDENAAYGSHTVEQYRKKAIEGVKGEIIRIPTRFLSAEDEIFKAIGYRQELNAIAYRTANKEGLIGDAFNQRIVDIIQKPSEEMMELAVKNAEYQTFTNPLGPIGKRVQQLSNSHPALKFIMPFVRTPTNILKYANERTPFGLLSKEIRDNIGGKNGIIARDTQIARLALGTAVATAVSWQVIQGNITGSGPTNSGKKATLYLTGWQPNSIKIGNGYYSYEWMEPLATIMGITSDVTEAYKNGIEDDKDAEKIASAAVSSISKDLMSKLSLRGVSDLIQMLSDQDRYGEKYFQNFLGSFIPSLSSQIARMNDPVLRETKSITDAFKARIPGLKNTLLPKRDVWGNPIVIEDALGPDIISPIRQSTFNNDPVNQRLLGLKYYPSKAQRKIMGVELTDQQYDDYARLSGKFAKTRLDSYVAIPGTNQLPPEIQIKTIKSIIDSSREQAATIVKMNNPDIIRQAYSNKVRPIKKP